MSARLVCLARGQPAAALRRSRILTLRDGARHRFLSSAVPPPPPSAETAATTAPSPSTPAARSSFRTATKFTLAPTQVNETNVPSAREVRRLIPTLRELRAQLPEARELEQQYIRPDSLQPPAAASVTVEAAAPGGEAPASGAADIFQKTTDPLEDLLFGPPKEEAAATSAEAQRPRGQHLLLAYRALLWGTLYAFLGFGATVGVAMYACGFHSLAELMDGVRGKMHRDEERLRASVGDGAAAPAAEHYVIDLTQPTEAWRQVQEVWAAVQRLAEEEDAKTRTTRTS